MNAARTLMFAGLLLGFRAAPRPPQHACGDTAALCPCRSRRRVRPRRFERSPGEACCSARPVRAGPWPHWRTLVARTPGAPLTIEAAVPQGRGVALSLVPTFPTDGAGGCRIMVAANSAAPTHSTIPREAGDAIWTQGVLDNRLVVPLPIPSLPGQVRLTISSGQAGLALDEILLRPDQPVAAAGR